MQNEKLVKLLTDYINSFDSKGLNKIKVIPLIEEDISIILDIDESTIEKIFNDDKKIEDFKFVKFIVKGIFEENLKFELTREQKNLIIEFISLSKRIIEDNLYEEDNLEEARKLLEILENENVKSDFYLKMDTDLINHIIAYQKLKPAYTNQILREILYTIETLENEIPDLNLNDNTLDACENEDRKLTPAENETIDKYLENIHLSKKLTEEKNIELYNTLINSNNIVETTSIRQQLIEGNIKLAFEIFEKYFKKYYPRNSLEEMLANLNLLVAETIGEYNPNKTSLEKLLNSRIRAFVKGETKKVDTPLSMEYASQMVGTIINDSKMDDIPDGDLRDIYNAMNPEQLIEEVPSMTDIELQAIDQLEIDYYLSKLVPIAAKLMRLRLGIGSIPMSGTEAAKVLGISQPYASILEKRSRETLAQYLKQTRSFSK